MDRPKILLFVKDKFVNKRFKSVHCIRILKGRIFWVIADFANNPLVDLFMLSLTTNGDS